jgi:hypothetical protein
VSKVVRFISKGVGGDRWAVLGGGVSLWGVFSKWRSVFLRGLDRESPKL